MSRWIQEMTWPDIAEHLERGRGDTVLVPVGATEQHGPHCPMGTDAAEAVATAEGVAERTDALIAPPLWFGWSPHHLAFPGTISLSADTLTRAAEDVCHSLIHHGFKHLVILNGHRVANLAPLEIAMVRVRNTTGAAVALVDLALVAGKEIRAVCESPPGGIGHACESETSFMLYKHPGLVKMDEAVDRIPEMGEFEHRFVSVDHAVNRIENVKLSFPPTIEEYGGDGKVSGVGGAPTLATAEKGEKIYDAIVANTVRFVESFKEVPVTIKGTFPPL